MSNLLTGTVQQILTYLQTAYYGRVLEDHVVVPLMGRFKGEIGDQNVLVMLTAVTTMGIDRRGKTGFDATRG